MPALPVRHKSRPLPSRFRIGGEVEKDKSTSLWLLDISERPDTEVDHYVRGVAQETIWQRPEAPAAPEKRTMATDHRPRIEPSLSLLSPLQHLNQ